MMNLLTRFFRPFFFVEQMSCQEQLRQDFGEFPPTPLRCESLTGEFRVVRTSGICRIYHDLTVQFFVMDADIESLSTDLVAKLGADIRNVQKFFQHLGPRTRWFMKRVLFGWLFAVRTAKAIRYRKMKPNIVGLFIPYFKDSLEISVKARGNGSGSDAHIVTHEHIHLLQHRNPESCCRYVRSPQDLLTKEGLADRFILYVLEKNEVEARLHESVLSFYRSHHHLPTTVSGFLGLLASSEIIGLLVIGILDSEEITFERGHRTYSEREAAPVEHLEWVLMHIKSPKLQRRYVTEVLPMMYSNLLKYYGDDVVSQDFLRGIVRPNFYDDLYGPQDA